MPADEDSDVEEMETENAEEGLPSYKQKYKELKSQLKCLVYEQECFESDIQGAQTRLLELSRDKSYLLDQLMRYEGVAISDDDETDYSSGEESAGQLPLAIVTQPQKPEPVPKSQPPVKHTQPSKAASTTQRQGTTRGSTGGQNPSSASKMPAGPKTAARKPKPSTKVSANSIARITKTVARARQPPTAPATSSLVVSLSLANLAQKNNQATQPPAVSTTAAQTQQLLTQAHVLHQAAQQLPILQNGSAKKPMPPLTTASSPSSSSSSSSSSSDSEDSGSDSSSSSERDDVGPMNIGGPVPIVTTAGSSMSGLLKPKPVTSPVKGPPQLIQAITSGVSSTPPPLLSPLTSPSAQLSAFSWSNRHTDKSELTSSPSIGFMPIAPPLSSPPASLPFSSFAKPIPGSAFHVVSPPNPTPASPSQEATKQ